MTREDWIRKLSSRKFWMAIAAFVSGLIAYFKNPGDPTALIMSFGAVVAYIVAEGFADASGAKSDVVWLPDEEKPPETPESDIGDE